MVVSRGVDGPDGSYEVVTRAESDRLAELFGGKTMTEPIRRGDRCDMYQELALLFAILAIGSTYNLELYPNDPLAEEYLQTCRRCLAMGKFMTHNSLAGVQALVC